MIIVSDTTPLNYLILIGRQDLLPELFGEVYVPTVVINELKHPATPQPVKLWVEKLPDWVIVKQPVKIISGLELDIGELEALSLAEEIGATDLLLDDMEARNIANARGFKVTGTLGVLLLAAKRKLINLQEALNKLQATNARIRPELIEQLLKQFT